MPLRMARRKVLWTVACALCAMAVLLLHLSLSTQVIPLSLPSFHDIPPPFVGRNAGEPLALSSVVDHNNYAIFSTSTCHRYGLIMSLHLLYLQT
jgi:hypothetical protein